MNILLSCTDRSLQGSVHIAEVSKHPRVPNRSSILTSLSTAAFTGQQIKSSEWVHLAEAEDKQDGVTNQEGVSTDPIYHNPQIVPCARKRSLLQPFYFSASEIIT